MLEAQYRQEVAAEIKAYRRAHPILSLIDDIFAPVRRALRASEIKRLFP